MTDYTPDMETVAIRYVIASLCDEGDRPLARAEFDRFIAKVKADALREAAENWRNNGWGHTAVTWLDDRADTIVGEAISKGAGDE